MVCEFCSDWVSPNEILSKKDDLLNFCLSNVYDKLSGGALLILNILRAARRNLNAAEIIFLAEVEPVIVRKYINELFTTTLIGREIVNKNSIEDMHYFITDFARDFLSRNYPVDINQVKNISAKLKNLTDSVSQLDQINTHNEFDVNAIPYNTSNERIAARFLTEALSLSKRKNINAALQKIDEAKGVVPNYAEVYRVSAFIKAQADDLLGADDDYRLGLEIDPDNIRLLYYYGQFLLFQLSDPSGCIDYAKKVYELRPNHPYTALLIARCNNRLQNYSIAIELVETLLSTSLNAKDKRIAYNDLMHNYTTWGKDLVKIQKDYSLASNNYAKSIQCFEICANENNLDERLVKSFTSTIYAFVSLIPSISLIQHSENIMRVILQYEFQIFDKYVLNKIVEFYENKIHKSINLKYPYDENITLYKGNIAKRSINYDKNFLFIEYDNSRIFAARKQFIWPDEMEEWENLREGQLVSFEMGTNKEGLCAVNIKLLF